MVAFSDAFPGFAVGDLDAARTFYERVLGVPVAEAQMPGSFLLTLPSKQVVFVYERERHVPAEFTVLYLVVHDVEAAVDELNAAGVQTKIYGDEIGIETDAKGIARGPAGPPIAWFRDPAANVLAVIEM